MAYLPVSAFQRPMTLAQLEQAERAEQQTPALVAVNKWTLFRALVKAKDQFSLSDRDLALLQGLLTFHPTDTLEAGKNLILFPSNKTICERMNGMADSTMRRHLRNLLASGLLLRRDSANGKRFSVTHHTERVAFGFDLTPLLLQAHLIFQAASEHDVLEQQAKQHRADVQLMRRDLYALIPLLPANAAQNAQAYWDSVSKLLRRKLSVEALEKLAADHHALLNEFKQLILTSSDVQNEQHNLNSNINYLDNKEADEDLEPTENVSNKTLSLETVIKACPQVEKFYGSTIRHWNQLVHAIDTLHSHIGISQSVYEKARDQLGLEQAAIVVAAILERFEKIRSPNAYLTHLTAQAALGRFNCKPMIISLFRAVT